MYLIRVDGLFILFPGDPSEDEYKSSILDDTTVKIWAVGSLLNKAEQWKDGSSRLFNLAVSDSEYIRDSMKHFQISCLFEECSGRWNKIHNPNPNTAIFVFGLMRDISKGGNIIVDLQSVALNVGPAMNTIMIAPTLGTTKKRKFVVSTSRSSGKASAKCISQRNG
ncbi:hypothetical protein K439DRAFT_1616660 [Ramaria rubella]|nr:hypothetical protein K439DRAFT_1616660 [Ramaria rubella]